MKSYKNVELFAKNAPVGAYAAGCPTHRHSNSRWGSFTCEDENGRPVYCAQCEVAD